MQFAFTQTASYSSAGYSYQAVLLDIPVRRVVQKLMRLCFWNVTTASRTVSTRHTYTYF